MVKVKYFGILADSVAKSEEELVFDTDSLLDLVTQLTEKYSLQSYDFQIAVNRKIISVISEVRILDSDEIAFLPAFAGG